MSPRPKGGGSARPFLKWAGGKTQLLPALLARLPEAFGAYHEPFVGGGALFFALADAKRLRKGATLTDVNPALIDTYRAVRDHVGEVIELLRTRRNDRDEFYEVRAWEPAALSLPQRAARVIYLNKTGFNGLYRENSKGRFNVPFGRYTNPTICNEPGLEAASRALQGVTIEVRPFEAVLEHAASGDLVYFDPPYVPVSTTASFTAYAKDGFGEAQQRRLGQVATELAAQGVYVVLSNSDTPLVREIYGDPAVFHVDTVPANRAINSRADRRGPVNEVIVRAGPT